MTRISSIEKSKGNSQALEQIAEDYLHLAQDAAGAVDTVTKKRHAEITSTRSADRTVKPYTYDVSIFKSNSLLSCLGELG